MMEINKLKSTFDKQMKKQSYDNSGRKDIFIGINKRLFEIVEEQQKTIEYLENVITEGSSR